MKRPQPELEHIMLADFLTNVSTVRKLRKYWGTKIEDGVEVLNQRAYYYPTKSQSIYYEKLFRFLGMYKDIEKAEMDGVKSAWVYFNKNKKLELPEGTEDEFVAGNLNKMWWDEEDGVLPGELTLITSIVIEAEFESSTSRDNVETVSTTELLNPAWSVEELRIAIRDNYEALWSTCLISQQGIGVINKGTTTDPTTLVTTMDSDDLSPDDPWLQTIARYAPLTTDIPYTILDVSIGYGKLENQRLYPTYVVTLEIPYMAFTTSSEIVELVRTDIMSTEESTDSINGRYDSATRTKLSYPNGYYTQQAIKKMSSADLEDDETLVTRDYLLWELSATGGYAALWYGLSLRADVFDNPRAYGLTYRELSTYVLQLIDSDYKKEPVSFWKKVVAVVIFIVAVVFAYWTSGASLVLVAVAEAILVGVLVLAILTIATSAMGATEWASAFAATSKMVAPLAIVATIILIWTGISAAITAAQNAVEGDAAAAAASAAESGAVATEVTAMDAVATAAEAGAVEVAGATLAQTAVQLTVTLVDNVVDVIITGATDLATLQATSASYKFLSAIIKIFNMAQKNKLEQLNDRLVDKQAEYEAMREEAEQETDVLQGFTLISASPATADWSMYAGLYDYPYEKSGGTLHTGNIQRTTKQALRKTTYDDNVFKGILIM